MKLFVFISFTATNGIFQMFQPKMEIGSSTLPPVFMCFLSVHVEVPKFHGMFFVFQVSRAADPRTSRGSPVGKRGKSCRETWQILDLYRGISQMCYIYIYTLWLFNIAMENGPFIDGLPGFTY